MPIELPDTPVAQAAAALAEEAAPAALLNHSYRTYLLGMLFVEDRDVDREAAFVASMVHDLGLTDRHRGDKGFDEVGADVAASFLEQRGWDTDRIRLVEQAIVRHTDLTPHDAPELRVVQAGATLDVAALPADLVTSDAAAEVLAAYPRLDFAEGMPEAFLAEVARVPDGSFANLERAVGLSAIMTNHPWDTATVR